jgi:hypothetical protein
MVLTIIQIIKVHENTFTSTYPPAVVALLVLSILQSLYTLGYLVSGGKTLVYKAAHVIGAFVFFWCFNFGAVVSTTVLRHDERYCPPTASNYEDCQGVMRVSVLGSLQLP